MNLMSYKGELLKKTKNLVFSYNILQSEKISMSLIPIKQPISMKLLPIKLSKSGLKFYVIIFPL